MFNMSDNYHLRKHFLKTKQLPTQSLIKNKMTLPLAGVYFKTMNKKLKVMIGLEPPMQGGGGDWYVPPQDLLEGRAVLKPLKKEYLSKLNYLGIDEIGMKMVQMRLKRLKQKRQEQILESDEKWKSIVETECKQFLEDKHTEAEKKNTEKIRSAFYDFTTLYSRSIDTIETMLVDAARTEVFKIREEAFQKMQDKYVILLKQQATTLYDIYTEKLLKEKSKLKAKFIKEVEVNRNVMGEKLHDIYLEKHIAIEKLRQYLECQNLACQVYVALKEREECGKEIELAKHKHMKKVKYLMQDIASKDYEICLQVKKEKKRQEFQAIWHNKVCHVVKKLQLFVSYCLSLLPEQAEFFINMEKLMLLQLNETLENPRAESIIVIDEEHYEGPLPNPNPFYLFCDQSMKHKVPINKDLCPDRCTSSPSQMPAIIIDNRCIYAACDNFKQFSNKIKCYIHGERGDVADFLDDHRYEHDVPVKYTSSQQLLELKLESSLLQVLQQEIPNIKEVPVECDVCKIPYCFCTCRQVSRSSVATGEKTIKQQTSSHKMSVNRKIKSRDAELKHVREPTWDSYIKHVEPRKCSCLKTTKKHLVEHLPVYMRSMSVYDEAELPNYEICSLTNLKDMVRQARGCITPPLPIESPSKHRDAATQCSDQNFDFLCTCFSDDEVVRLFKNLITSSKMFDPTITNRQFQIVDETLSRTSIDVQECSHSTDEALSLTDFFDCTSEMKEIFTLTGRTFH